MKYNEDKLSDQQLVERVLLGDTEAFRSVIDRTQGLVTQIVFKMVANQEDRRDIAQDVYLKVFHKLSSLSSSQSFLPGYGRLHLTHAQIICRKES